MNRHQVLTGACNNGERCHAIGSVEGIHFTAYAAGCDIVILASDFQRVQIIPGVTHGNVRVSCIDCATDSGKIAASYQKKVYVFEPAPLLNHDTTHKLDYHWYQTAVFEAECVVNCLTWTLEGTRLLTAGDVIQIWGQTHDPSDDHAGGRKVMFMVGQQDGLDNGPQDDPGIVWEPIWKCKPATTIQYLQFSPDGLLFASAGKDDRLVKIWYEDRKLQLPLSHADSIVSPKKDSLHYSFIYIAHPRAVTGFSWRRTSKYMPRGSVANMLITSCRDNVCRIWCETILPDDGLVDLEQCDPNASFDPKFHTHRHKKRFMQRLKTIRHAIHKRRRHKLGPEVMMSVPEMSNSTSVHDFHKFAIHQNGVAPALHFHLSASINPETDIPLLPVVSGKHQEHDFQLHWLNNKELQFTMESEKILQELHRSTMADDHDHRYYDSADTDSDSCSETHDRGSHDGHWKRKKRSFRNKHRKSNGNFGDGIRSNNASFASMASEHSDVESSEGSRPISPDMQGSLVDMLDRKIENLLKDWHQHCDMLFSIHPVDGSFLVWLVDWLDEYTPYSFRQAQVSFSSRLPRAFPIPDARTMTSNLLLYCNYSKMDIKSAMKMCEHDYRTEHRGHQSAAASGKGSPGQNDNMLIPNVLMISKHLNGSLNQWQISFSENSQFTTVVSVAHASRACGHRFRTSSAVCHPALPLLITTSQHNVPSGTPEEGEQSGPNTPDDNATNSGIQFCSELILWRVDPVGPLSKSGGIVELARVNTPQVSAFCNIAWVPTLLPSSILGPYSNSPSTLFVASDGECLRLYQAVNDARSLLMEVNTRKEFMSFSSVTSSGYSADVQEPATELFSIISEQSSARPGCIIELDSLTDGQQTWQHIQLLHVFQEQLVTGKSSSKGDNSGMEPIVDLRNMGSFEENFFIVLLEKSKAGGSVLHMWKLTIASQLGPNNEAAPNKTYCMDYDVVVDDDSNPPSRCTSPEPDFQSRPSALAKLVFSTTKVLSQKLPLPGDVEVVSAAVGAGHLSSASMFPACLAPYLLVTACSDGEVRFWRCDQAPIEGPVNEGHPSLHSQLSYKTRSFEFGVEEEDGVRRRIRRSSIVNSLPDTLYTWLEWTPLYEDDQTSSIYIPGKPITVSCAYTGRIAVAYRSGAARSCATNPENLFVNLCVAIFECESTGGSEWVREDTIELKNIRLPEHHAEVDLDLHPTTDRLSLSENESPQTLSPATSFINMSRTKSVPSMSAICSARKELENHSDQLAIMRPTHLVQLDWVSTEDGSHILTVGVGSKVMMYAQVSNDIVQESQKESDEKIQKSEPLNKVPLKDPMAGRRAMLQRSKSMVVDNYQEELQWMKLRCVELSTADGLPPLPMHMSWVRGGIMVIGMDNEMHVYSQWRFSQGSRDYMSFPVDNDIRSFEEMNLVSVELKHKQKSVAGFTPSYSMPNFKKMASQVKEFPKSTPNLKKTLERSESSLSLTVIHELGLFEAARQSSPVLPQYHPKSLMELLNFGKVKRVKAILAHLVRCIAGRDATRAMYVEDIEADDSRYLHRQRTISMAQSPGEAPKLNEERALDYVEIKSIPPLPLYALLAADSDQGQAQADIVAHPGPMSPSEKADYKDLFHTSTTEEEVLDLNVLSTSAEGKPRSRTLSASAVNHNPNHFSSNQAQLLCKHLTHMHLPGLSGQDQMYLLALADTVAHTKTDFADSFEAAGSQTIGGHPNQPAESLDDCGLRFFLAMRHHMYLTQSLPPGQRAGLQRAGLKTFNLVWAFHSEATDELLSLIPSHHKGELKWADLKVFGAGWWINNINILKRTIEKVAKAAFHAKKDPMDAALFYLAMKKKNVLWGLFRSINDKRMSEFFRNDFSQERWRKAALKNAYSLLGFQRFEHAAGFFLLAGSLKDAVEVCLHNLHDLQLALVICRLYEGEEIMSPSVKKILYTAILGCDDVGDNHEPGRAHPDPFLRSMAYWLMKQYRSALQTLLSTDRGSKPRAGHHDTETASTSNVFNFYNYLRTHPLLIRHRIVSAAPALKHRSVIHGFTKQQTIVGSPDDEVASFVDRVTPMERRLFFSTAHEHCKNGCPILALEVLSKLPVVINMDEDVEPDANVPVKGSDTCIDTGRIPGGEETIKVNGVSDTAKDWSQPISTTSQQGALDWNQPVSTSSADTSNAMDWGQPTRNFDMNDELDLRLSSSESEPDSDLDDTVTKERIPSIVVEKVDKENNTENTTADNYKTDALKTKAYHVDIFAQQYKFIACLKVMMEEMQTLATGFEVDGGQLRYQMYIWLEREVEALKWLCHYGEADDADEDQTVISDGAFDDDDAWPTSPLQRQMSNRSRSGSVVNRPTLHEVILAEKMDFEAKLARMGRRKQWLRQNQQLLRTLVAYCVLQGAAGGGLASVQMELLLLLQELQQEKPQQQLLSPLPFPTTLPLLSASIASSKTVTSDPIQHLQCLSQDLLHSVIEFTSPPGLGAPLHTVLVMRNLSIALSSCIYQTLCDSDSFVVSLNENTDIGMEGFIDSQNFMCDASHLMAGVRRHRRRSFNSNEDTINTSPARWPGVTSLRVLLAREKDEDAPKLSLLLTESLISVYASLLINGLATYDCHMLYRLLAHRFDQQLWASLFGGGVKSILKLANQNQHSSKPVDDLHKQRMKLNMKIMGQGPGKKDHKTYKEKFVPPELSMISFFMTKPFIVNSDESTFSYDSEESLSSEEEDEDDEDGDEIPKPTRPTSLPISSLHEHSDPSSYSWCLVRYAMVKLAHSRLANFLPQIGLEPQDLPVCSPLLHAVLRSIEQWEEVLLGKLELFAAPPDNYIPSIEVDITPGVPVTKYTALLDKSNSPFINSHSTLPIKRLWFHLIRQDLLKNVFLRYVFRKPRDDHTDLEDSSIDGTDSSRIHDPMKIIHKEQDIITAFAINKANHNCITLATQKELVELDITHILNPPQWLEDENEMDIECLNNSTPSNPMENVNFLVVHTPADGPTTNPMSSGTTTPLTGLSSAASTPTVGLAPGQLAQTGRGSNLITRRVIPGVRRIGAHPSLPHYLTGSTDGSVRLWEWSHNQPLAVLRSPGNFPKVTKVLFNAQGNKCCVSDTEGQICLWQVGHGSNFNKPIMSLSCHNKTTSDFVFVGSSSLIATAGHSSENRNVCLWDTLLPQRSACVHAFNCHEHGSPALVYAPHHQLLISSGRKGEICIFDIRQRQMRHTFQAHESPIRCLALDPEEEYFVTGSADGDIKVWGLAVHQLVVSFPGEHSRSSTFFRNMGSATGVTQVGIGPNHHLFSCGVDGSMKFRSLPERESIVRFWAA